MDEDPSLTEEDDSSGDEPHSEWCWWQCVSWSQLQTLTSHVWCSSFFKKGVPALCEQLALETVLHCL
jgi:hypothetical protein